MLWPTDPEPCRPRDSSPRGTLPSLPSTGRESDRPPPIPRPSRRNTRRIPSRTHSARTLTTPILAPILMLDGDRSARIPGYYANICRCRRSTKIEPLPVTESEPLPCGFRQPSRGDVGEGVPREPKPAKARPRAPGPRSRRTRGRRWPPFPRSGAREDTGDLPTPWTTRARRVVRLLQESRNGESCHFGQTRVGPGGM